MRGPVTRRAPTRHRGWIRNLAPLTVASVFLWLELPRGRHTTSHSTATCAGVKHAVFINRDARTDRRAQIESTLERARIRATRIDAVEVFTDESVLSSCWDGGSYKCAGQVGCQRSHLKALTYAMLNQWEHVAVFEDDFEWQKHTDVGKVQCVLSQLMTAVPDWDFIAVSLNIQNSTVVMKDPVQIGRSTVSSIVKINQALATHGYLIRARAYERLYEVLENCNITGDLFTAIDTCWQRLQLELNWYGLRPQLGTQGESYSGIENRIVSYTKEYNIT